MNLAVLVLLGTVSATLLDYVFKSGALAQYAKGPQLTLLCLLAITACTRQPDLAAIGESQIFVCRSGWRGRDPGDPEGSPAECTRGRNS